MLVLLLLATIINSQKVEGWIVNGPIYIGDDCRNLGLNLTRLPGDPRVRFEFIYSLSPRHDSIGICTNMVVSGTLQCHHIISWPSATCAISNTTITCDCGEMIDVFAVSIAGLCVLVGMLAIMGFLAVILFIRCVSMTLSTKKIVPIV